MGANAEANLKLLDGQKRVLIGKKGVRATRMMLDPEAHSIPDLPGFPETNEDLLYLAAGRDGLWMMEAFVGPGPPAEPMNLAWRIDDSGNMDPQVQESRRWCNDVAVMTVAGKRYLLALFGSKSASRLRVYDLEEVRALGQRDASDLRVFGEVGYELSPVKQVPLGDNPNEPQPDPPPPTFVSSFGRSLALAMDVDPIVTTPGAEQAEVYVAMGHHGLVKVHFPGDPAAVPPVTTWGPILGDETPYALGTASTPMSPDAYAHAAYWEDRPYASTAKLGRYERPMLCDVAVYDGPLGRHLYVAADHLFWFRLDLADTFGPSMKIDYHAGFERDFELTNHPSISVKVVSWDGQANTLGKYLASAARALRVARGPDGEDYLVVTTNSKVYVKDYLIETGPGYGYDHEFSYGGPWGLIVADEQSVFVYRLASGPDPIVQIERFTGGGGELFVPPMNPQGKLEVFHKQNLPDPDDPTKSIGSGICRARIDLGGGPVEVVNRSVKEDMAGRVGFFVGAAIADTNPQLNSHLLLPSGNDGFFPRRSGFIVTKFDPGTGEWDIKHYFDPDPDYNEKGDIRGPNGLILDADSQWSEAPNELHVFCGGTDPTPALPEFGNTRHQLVLLSVPDDVWTTSPDRSKNVFLAPAEDDLGTRGRASYLGGTMSREFDAWLDAQPGESGLRHLITNRVRSVYGTTVFDRAKAQAKLLGAPDDNKSHYIDTLDDLANIRDLVLGPEFNRLPRSAPDARNLWTSNNLGNTSPHYSWPPRLVQVYPEGGSNLGAWVLAAPAGTIRAHPDWKVFVDHPDWLPPQGSIWQQNLSHGKVVFFPMIPDGSGSWWPETTTTLDANGGKVEDVSPLSALIGPDAEGMIWKVLSVTMPTGPSGEDEVYLASVDFGGRIYVHEIQDILSRRDPDASIDDLLVARWEAPLSVFDDVGNPVWDLAIHYPGSGTKANFYVSVRRTGIQVLEFDPTLPVLEDRLAELSVIQVADYAMGLALRTVEGETQLVVSDQGAGIRIYGD